MTKRVLAVLVCLLLLSASGCEFLAAPTASPSPSGTDSTASPEPLPTEEPAGTGEPTEAPTEEPTPEPTPTSDPAEGMIFPDSDTRVLMWSELIALEADKLDLARNEIFARAGYKFTKEYYTDYYGKLGWYKVDPAFKESNFSKVQLANIHLVQFAEEAIKGKLRYVPSGTVLDFDQDGGLETLTYSAPDDYHVVVKIKDGSVTTTWNIECDTPSRKAYLGDIDREDGMLDLFVDEFGPSDDYTVYVAGLKHKSFLNRTPTDKLPGTITQLKLDGEGSISTKKRMNILMTWFCSVKYRLNGSGMIAFVPQSSYSMGNFACTTKVAIPLKATASSSGSVALTVPAGTPVKLVSTDDVKWIKIKAPGGTGWLEMETAMTLVNPHISSFDAFDGLVIAD